MAIANSMDLAARAGRVNISLDDNEAFQTNKFGAVWMTEEDHGPLVCGRGWWCLTVLGERCRR